MANTRNKKLKRMLSSLNRMLKIKLIKIVNTKKRILMVSTISLNLSFLNAWKELNVFLLVVTIVTHYLSKIAKYTHGEWATIMFLEQETKKMNSHLNWSIQRCIMKLKFKISAQGHSMSSF